MSRPFTAQVAPDAQQDRIRQGEVRLDRDYGGSPYVPLSAVTPVMYSGGGLTLNGAFAAEPAVEGYRVEWHAQLARGRTMPVTSEWKTRREVRVNPGELRDSHRVRRIRSELAHIF